MEYQPMPILQQDEDHPLWSNIRSTFKSIIVKRCFDSLPKILPIPLRNDLLRLSEVTSNNPIFKSALTTLVNELGHQKLNKNQATVAIKRLIEIPGIREALHELADQIIVQANLLLELPDIAEDVAAISALPPADPEFFVTLDTPLFEANLHQWVVQEYSPVDERVLTSDERRLRRMDSLSRLLSIKPTLSVCAAVTIDTAVTPRVLMGMNVGKNGEQNLISMAIENRLNIIKNYIETISFAVAEGTFSNLAASAEELVRELLPHGGNGVPEEILLQAATKFLHAMCFDKLTFTEEERKAFRSKASMVIILPKVDEQGCKMEVRSLTDEEWIISTIDLKIQQKISIKDIHAEQLLARFMFRDAAVKPEGNVIFGISKLCCRTCFDNLTTYPDIITRGHHGQFYQGVVNLNNGQSPTSSSTRRATTHAWPSPKDTPDRDEHHTRSDGAALSSAASSNSSHSSGISMRPFPVTLPRLSFKKRLDMAFEEAAEPSCATASASSYASPCAAASSLGASDNGFFSSNKPSARLSNHFNQLTASPEPISP